MNQNKISTTDKIFSVNIKINDEDIIKVKKLFIDKFNSIYDISPHITLFVMPLDKLSHNLITSFEYYIKNLYKFYVKILQPKIITNKNFYYINIESYKLKNIHKSLIYIAKNYKTNIIRKKDLIRIRNNYYSKEEVKNIFEFSFPLVLNKYTPHITIGDISNKSNVAKPSKELILFLSNIINTKQLLINEIEILYHTDSVCQSKMKVLFQKKISLKNCETKKV